MTACAIRYRLDGPGPAAFLVECDGELRVYARGALGAALPSDRLLALLADRDSRWLPDSGSVDIDDPLLLTREGNERRAAAPPSGVWADAGGREASAG